MRLLSAMDCPPMWNMSIEFKGLDYLFFVFMLGLLHGSLAHGSLDGEPSAHSGRSPANNCLSQLQKDHPLKNLDQNDKWEADREFWVQRLIHLQNLSSLSIGPTLLRNEVLRLRSQWPESNVQAIFHDVQERLRVDPSLIKSFPDVPPPSSAPKHSKPSPKDDRPPYLDKGVFSPQLLGTQWGDKIGGFLNRHLSPNGERLLSIIYHSGKDQDILQLHTLNGTLIRAIDLADDDGIAAFSPNGKSFAVSSRHGPIALFDSETGLELTKLNLTKESLRGLEWVPNSKKILLVTVKNNWSRPHLKIWNTESHQDLVDLNPIRSLWKSPRNQHRNSDLIFRFSQDGHFVSSYDWNEGTAKVWDLQSGQFILNVFSLCRECRIHTFTPDGSALLFKASNAQHNQLKALDLNSKKTHSIPSLKTSPSESLGNLYFNRTGDLMVANDRGELKVIVFKYDRGSYERVYDLPDEKINSMSSPFYRQDQVLITKDFREFKFYLRDIQTGQILHTIDANDPRFPLDSDKIDHDSEGFTLPDSGLFTTVDEDGHPYFWSLFHRL